MTTQRAPPPSGSDRPVTGQHLAPNKNLWVSFGAHLLNDWVTFSFVLVADAARG